MFFKWQTVHFCSSADLSEQETKLLSDFFLFSGSVWDAPRWVYYNDQLANLYMILIMVLGRRSVFCCLCSAKPVCASLNNVHSGWITRHEGESAGFHPRNDRCVSCGSSEKKKKKKTKHLLAFRLFKTYIFAFWVFSWQPSSKAPSNNEKLLTQRRIMVYYIVSLAFAVQSANWRGRDYMSTSNTGLVMGV